MEAKILKVALKIIAWTIGAVILLTIGRLIYLSGSLVYEYLFH